MTEDVAADRGSRRTNVWLGIVLAVGLVLIAGLIVGSRMSAAHKAAVRHDQYFCAGQLDPLAVGPETNRLCADLLRNVPGVSWGE